MNKERILMLADDIVSNTDRTWDIRFTVTCFIRFTNALWPMRSLLNVFKTDAQRAASTLGLTEAEVEALFYPDEANLMLDQKDPDLWITREVAAETLRNFANTGTIRFMRPTPDQGSLHEVAREFCPE